jgi:hypothetical protein
MIAFTNTWSPGQQYARKAETGRCLVGETDAAGENEDILRHDRGSDRHEFQFPQSLPAMATLLMMRKVIKIPQSWGCRVAFTWSGCSGGAADILSNVPN